MAACLCGFQEPSAGQTSDTALPKYKYAERYALVDI